jgi:uncharacterized metal-binding protein YceD (DUF177 family)
MSHSDKFYDIPFVGLKIGKHQFNYEIEDAYFDGLEYSLVQKGKLTVALELEKKETMMLANFKVQGLVYAECDRCTAPLELEINGEYNLIYKFGLEEAEDETLVVLHPDEYQINVKAPIYELIIISLPIRKIHKKGECDEEMWNLVKEYTINAEDNEEEENYDFNPDDFGLDDEDWDDDLDDENPDDDDDDDESPWEILKNLN